VRDRAETGCRAAWAAETGKTLCLNMIVKNETANLERCLASLAAHIACWIIGDTGSSDGTQAFIREFFAARGVPGELHEFAFENFAQARNEALARAVGSPFDFDYLLLADADMELVVDDPAFRSNLGAAGHSVLQRAGISYWNTRLVRRDVGALYRGVTHEYLDVPGGVERLHGVWFKDHANGSNRVDKFERDIRLLRAGLEMEPDNARYWFYLGQSFRDAGRHRDAAAAYAKRAEMGGWEEEAWYARLQQARALRALGDEAGFFAAALRAFSQRPQRAEPLHDLARFYRERGMNDASVLFSEAGLALPPPAADMLFLEDFVYTAGLKEEFSIAANYARDPARKERGFSACNWLALRPEVGDGSRALARSNLRFYARPAAAMMPSFAARPVDFVRPDGWHPMNPSVARSGDDLLVVQRCVNYTLCNNVYETPHGVPVTTRNFLLRLGHDLNTVGAREILQPQDWPAPAFDRVLGGEDLRLFAWRGALWCSATVRQLNPEGWCEQLLARLDDAPPGPCRLTDWRVLQPQAPRRHEKNWMPCVVGDVLRFVYQCDPTRVLDDEGQTVGETVPAIDATEFHGGSQLLPFAGGWLAIVHEVLWASDAQSRFYHHRFIWFDAAMVLRGISRPFFLRRPGIEFAAGLAWHPDRRRLIVSFGVGDAESWLATIAAAEVRDCLEDAANLRTGIPAAQMERITPPSALAPAVAIASDDAAA